MNTHTKIRKLPPSNSRELSQILEYNESWKKLMAIIPKVLDKDNFECKITEHNRHKYHSEHFKQIENGSALMKKSCSEILFDEWGTSGRVTPELGHLLYLLTKAELFRAADYVAVKLLNVEPPNRPAEGPAARVSVDLIQPKPNSAEIERILDAIDYPSSVINNIINNNSNEEKQIVTPPVVPQIVISQVTDVNANADNIPVVVQTQDNSANVEQSDMIKFSQSEIRPNITDIMLNSATSECISKDTSDYSNSSDESDAASSMMKFSQTTINDSSPIPCLSKLIVSDSVEPNVPAISTLLHSKNEPLEPSSNSIPNSSILNVNQENSSLPLISSLMSDTMEIKNPVVITNDGPQFSALLLDNKSNSNFLPVVENTVTSCSSKESNATLNISPTSSLTQNSNLSNLSRTTKCTSPLPNLSLNTLLPHFSYNEIETATNNFDETQHKTCKEVENSMAVTNGRFLGSGAFGSVFLGLGLCEKPVAVKKLFLSNEDVVNIDDAVTIQFKNEVEVLSKYKHENLLSLVGYSCDGPTYCLLYEYIPGGALKDRLQNTEEKLIWTDRLYIALGTARAISYLHTAYKTPLIHRDIKTANILLDCTNKPQLCDFGLIKLIPNQNTNTKTSAFGTSAYMAREAFRGDVSVKLDTFSFGVVLLELITGLPPLDEAREGCDIVTHIEDKCDESIAPLIDHTAGDWLANNINYAEKLYTISIECLQENKKNRPTMVEISEKLSQLIVNSI